MASPRTLGSKLRHQVRIESFAYSQDAYGGAVEAWSEVATMYAGVEPLSGREFFQAQTINESLTVRFRFRWRPDISLDTDMRIIDLSVTPNQVYDIKTVQHTMHGRREWVALATLTADEVE